MNKNRSNIPPPKTKMCQRDESKLYQKKLKYNDSTRQFGKEISNINGNGSLSKKNNRIYIKKTSSANTKNIIDSNNTLKKTDLITQSFHYNNNINYLP